MYKNTIGGILTKGIRMRALDSGIPLPSPLHCSRKSAWLGLRLALRETDRTFPPEGFSFAIESNTICKNTFYKIYKYIWQFGQIYWPPLWEIVAAPTAYRSYSTPLAWTAGPPGGVTSFLQDLWNFQGSSRLWWKSFWQYVCLLDSESWQKCRNMSCWEVVLHNYLCTTISNKTMTSADVGIFCSNSCVWHCGTFCGVGQN